MLSCPWPGKPFVSMLADVRIRLNSVGECPRSSSSTRKIKWFVPESTPNSNCWSEIGRTDSTVPSISTFDSAATTFRFPVKITAKPISRHRDAKNFCRTKLRFNFDRDFKNAALVCSAYLSFVQLFLCGGRTDAPTMTLAKSHKSRECYIPGFCDCTKLLKPQTEILLRSRQGRSVRRSCTENISVRTGQAGS
jgi:hypothetical protein